MTPAQIRLAMTFANVMPADRPLVATLRTDGELSRIAAALADHDAAVVSYATTPGAIWPAVIETIGLDLAAKAATAGSLFFKANPAALETLDGLRGRPMAPFAVLPFADVAQAFAAAGLVYVGPAHLADAIDKLNFSADMMALLRAEPDTVIRETKKDLLLNRGYRRDIFARAPQAVAPRDAAGQIAAMTFQTAVPEIEKMTLLTAYAEIKPTAHAHRVFNALLDGPASAIDLASRAGDCPDPWRNMEAMLALAAMDAVEPVEGRRPKR